MKKTAKALLLIALCLGLSSCGSKLEAATIHNTRLGCDIYIGMQKTDIDKLLGEPAPNDIYYVYVDSGLAAVYKEGKATMLIVTDSTWTAVDGITTDSSIDSVTAAYGELSSSGGSLYMFDSNSKITAEKDKAKCEISISTANDAISSYAVMAGIGK